MTVSALTPTQQQVVEGLMAKGQARPTFDASLPERLRAELEAGLAPARALLDGDQLFVTRGALSQVHQCELHHVTEEKAGFSWSARTASGSVTHKALELGMTMRNRFAPMQLVDSAIDSIIETGVDSSLRSFLMEATDVELAELRSFATDRTTKFQDSFPPLEIAWRPRLESRLKAELCSGQILLQGKVDLALGMAQGTTARVLIIDLKTGRPSQSHIEELRFYALLETLRVGVPPFRLASFYLDSGRWHHEDVTTELLQSTVRRIVDGVLKIAQLKGGREPTFTPGYACGYCTLRDECEGAREWDKQNNWE